jgi:hypothetical protein
MVAKKTASTAKAATTKAKAPVKAKAVSKKVVQKKTTKKKAAPKKPVITPAMFDAYFAELSQDKFKELSREWNETRLKVKIPKLDGYDQWLNYFKTLTPNTIKQLAETGLDFLPTEGYAALAWWHDVIASPYRMDKIHKAGLTSGGDDAKPKQTISQLAAQNDRIGVLKAIRDSVAAKLDKGAGSRDTAALAAQMTEIMTQIADFEKRQGPKKETKLGQILGEYQASKSKAAVGKATNSRKTSFKTRVTIDDTEAA